MNIPIGLVKGWRESIDATVLVVFAIGRDGQQHVATHGETEQDAKNAAKAGNKLKVALGWPEDLCRARPLERKCKNCTFYGPDYGIYCANGWSGDGSSGHCLHKSHWRTAITQDDRCADFEPKV